MRTDHHPSPPRTASRTRRSLRFLISSIIVTAALSAVVVIHQLRTAGQTTPTLASQFADWMSDNTQSNVEISKVSCLDPSAAGTRATCQFTATVDPQDHPTYYHDFKCTAELDPTGTVATVQCPANIAWIISTRVNQ